MRWQGRRQSDNVEDMRDSSGGAGPGGGGFRIPGGGFGGGGGRVGAPSIGFLIVAGIVLWMLGINPLVLLNGGAGLSSPQTVDQSRPQGGSNDEMKQFVSTVLADTEDTWSQIFSAAGETYTPKRLALLRNPM